MKTTRYLLVLVFLALPGRSFAERLMEHMTKESAEKLGVTFRSVQGDDSIQVWIEFTPKDNLKNFTEIELGIGDPKKRIMAAPLQSTRPTPETVSAHFATDWAHFPVSSLTILTNDGRLSQFGYVFKVSDFIGKEGAEKKKTADASKATIKRLDGFSSRFTTSDGKEFTIGGITAEQEVWHFLCMFKDGDTCELPAAFTAFNSRKCYSTAAEIKGMPACKATVKVQAPCYTIYTATDGTVLIIGDPGSDETVVSFLNSQEKGHTCQLPDAFLEYQKKNP